MNVATVKIPVKEIRLTRAEGLISECVTVTVDSWQAANHLLWQWSESAPKEGGYDKCDFRIEFTNGEVYEGRFDLMHWTREAPDLKQHVSRFVGFCAGRYRPPHIKTDEDYQRVLRRLNVEPPQYAEWMDKYDV